MHAITELVRSLVLYYVVIYQNFESKKGLFVTLSTAAAVPSHFIAFLFSLFGESFVQSALYVCTYVVYHVVHMPQITLDLGYNNGNNGGYSFKSVLVIKNKSASSFGWCKKHRFIVRESL